MRVRFVACQIVPQIVTMAPLYAIRTACIMVFIQIMSASGSFSTPKILRTLIF